MLLPRQQADQLQKTAILQIQDRICQTELLADEKRRAELGHNALRVVRENRGAIVRTADIILENLKDHGIYIVPEK